MSNSSKQNYTKARKSAPFVRAEVTMPDNGQAGRRAADRAAEASPVMRSLPQDIFVDSESRPRLLRGLAIGTASPRLVEMAGRVGFEAVWIEMEHGSADFREVEACCIAADAAGAAAVVRVPDGQRHHVLRALETGARVVIVPMVESAEYAQQIVRFGKFPPMGERGYNTRSRATHYGLVPCPEAFARANRTTHLMAQIESVMAVEKLEAICAVEGLSGIFIGPGDLSVSLGVAGQLNHARLVDVTTQCITRARAMGKRTGILAGPGPLLDAAVQAGCQLAICGGDIWNLASAWPNLLAAVPAAKEAP